MNPPNENQWHYTDGANSFGPLGSTTIRQLISAGVVAADFHLRRDGENTWLPLAEVDLDAPPEPSVAPAGPPPPPVNNAVYHLTRNGATSGPLGTDELRGMILRQEVSATDLVWTEGMAGWSPVGDISDLRLAGNLLPPPPPPSVTRRNPNAPLVIQGQSQPATKGADNMGVILVLIPIISAVLMWFWVSGMRLRQNPSNVFGIFIAGTILLTAALAAIDSGKREVVLNLGRKQVSSPVGWFLLIAPLWIASLPAYLFCRKRSGANNYFAGGIIAVVVFTGAAFATYRSIDLRQARADAQKSLWQMEDESRMKAIYGNPRSPSLQESRERMQGITDRVQGIRSTTCKACSGTGNSISQNSCATCLGAGTKTTPSGYDIVCTTCGGSGRSKATCLICRGTGKGQ